MAELGIFKYIRLKLIATVLRAVTWLGQSLAARKERPLYDDITRERIRIPSRSAGRFMDAWLYYPPNYSASTPAPLVVNWHGSGFVFPALSSDRTFCARVAREVGALVLDADYRKAPENPFPAAVHDVEDALRWVASQHKIVRLDRVAISGFSAGGNLALVAASELRPAVPELDVRAVIAFYPPTDISIDPAAKSVPHPKKPLPVGIQNAFNDCYTPDAAARKDPRVSPSFAKLDAFPQTVAMFTCSGDTLYPEAHLLADKLKNGIRKVTNIVLDDVSHAFDKGCAEGSNDWTQRELAYATAVDVLKEALL